MNSVRFIFCVHHHQPTGNFDSVNEAVYASAYKPFLDLVAEYPEFAVCLHTSGCLLEWLESHHGEYLAKLGRLVERGQVELVGGAMYEPMLPVWPEDQMEAQIRAHREFTQRWFGRSPETFWLPERVWEPRLALPLSRLGVKALPVDDSMLKPAGVSGAGLLKTWFCGPTDRPLRLFPMSESLRYKIPFGPVGDTLSLLQAASERTERAVMTYGDDGEKFGGWPGTHHHVYVDGWLRRFIEGVLAHPAVKLTHFSECYEDPADQVVLPAGTYPEMIEWSRQAGGDAPVASDLNPWRNFLTKYTEAGRLQRMVEDFASESRPSTHLLRAQCNCAYWHGVFGGVYLPHLRSALYEELARWRHEAPPKSIEVKSGSAGHYLSTPDLDLGVDRMGGALTLILQHDPPFNWACTLTRRPEAYHNELKLGKSSSRRGLRSVHSPKGSRRNTWSKWLVYDPYERASLLDHFLPGRVTLAQFEAGVLSERATFVREAYDVAHATGQITLTGSGDANTGFAKSPVSLTKTLRASGDGSFLVSYSVRCDAATKGRFGVEWNLSALAPAGPDRWLQINGRPAGEPRSRGRHPGVTEFGIVDRWGGKAIHVEVDLPGTLLYFGLHTVSQSERSYEQVYQQTAFLVHWPIPADGQLRIRFQVQTAKLPV